MHIYTERIKLLTISLQNSFCSGRGMNWRDESPVEFSFNPSENFSVKNKAINSTFSASCYSRKINSSIESLDMKNERRNAELGWLK